MLIPARIFLGIFLLSPLQAIGSSMVALDDSALSHVDAQHGVLLNISVRNNITATGAPIGCTPVVGNPNPCRLGLEFAARNGVWLMFKEYYGSLQFIDLRMESDLLPNGNTVYWNVGRFDGNGNSGCTAPLLPACSPAGNPAVKMSYPNPDAPNVYNDFRSFLNIGRAWLEFDNGATPGYQRDTSLNSVFGVRMSDSTAINEPARMRFRGNAHVYGF